MPTNEESKAVSENPNPVAEPEAEEPPPFYYTGTDSSQPDGSGAVGYSMSPDPDNLAPALLVWLFLTTNPTWPHYIAVGAGIPSKNSPSGVLTVADIASQVGLTTGCVQTIFDLATKGPNASDVMSALNLVGRTFQSIKALDKSPTLYKPPCAPYAENVLALAPSALAENPAGPVANPAG